MLRDVREDDLPIFFEHQRDPEACRMAAFPPREHDAFLLHWRTKVIGDPAARKRTIVVDDGVVGNIGSWDADGRRFVGYWIGQEFWGRGIATAALSEFLSEEPTRPLYAYVAVQNRGSIRVLQKCGFRQIGGNEPGSDGVGEYLFQLGD
jgi:RimJ/RimL family protein N-acetyltransferase